MDRVLLARLTLAATALAAVGLVTSVATAPLALQVAAAPDAAPSVAACSQVASRPRPEGRCGELHDGLSRACDALRIEEEPAGARLDVDAAMLQYEASGCWGGES